MDSSDDASLEWSKEQQRMMEARDFIDSLIVSCDSSVSQSVQKANLKNDTDTSNYKEWDWYNIPENGMHTFIVSLVTN